MRKYNLINLNKCYLSFLFETIKMCLGHCGVVFKILWYNCLFSRTSIKTILPLPWFFNNIHRLIIRIGISQWYICMQYCIHTWIKSKITENYNNYSEFWLITLTLRFRNNCTMIFKSWKEQNVNLLKVKLN